MGSSDCGPSVQLAPMICTSYFQQRCKQHRAHVAKDRALFGVSELRTMAVPEKETDGV